MKPLLLLSTLHRNHAAHSGYQELAAYLPEARFLHTIRADPAGGLPLLGARVARRLAFSRWYLGGSAALEAQAWGGRNVADRQELLHAGVGLGAGARMDA